MRPGPVGLALPCAPGLTGRLGARHQGTAVQRWSSVRGPGVALEAPAASAKVYESRRQWTPRTRRPRPTTALRSASSSRASLRCCVSSRRPTTGTGGTRGSGPPTLDTQTYASIAAAAPGFPHTDIGSAFTERFAVPWVLGSAGELFGVGPHTPFRVMFALFVIVTLALWSTSAGGWVWAASASLLCVGLFALNPYVFQRRRDRPGTRRRGLRHRDRDRALGPGGGALRWRSRRIAWSRSWAARARSSPSRPRRCGCGSGTDGGRGRPASALSVPSCRSPWC